MQQPMCPQDPMGQQPVMLCPVRLVYETQILLQPGESIHPNQTMYMNSQNPPPWIQNRPQNPVIYMQQMPNGMMQMPQHMLTDQNQLYIQNYPYQPQMVQIDPMRQMPNVMTQNMMGVGTNVGQTMHNVRPGLQNVGQGLQNVGQGMQNAGPGGQNMQNVGPGLQNVGQGLQNVGSGVQNVGPGMQNIGQGLQNVEPGTQNVGQGTQNVGPGSQNVEQGLQNVGQSLQNVGQGLQNAGSGLQNVGQNIQNVGLNIGQNMPMGNVIQNVQKVVPNFTQNIGNDRVIFNIVPNTAINAMGMANNQPTFNVNQIMSERLQMNQNLVNMQKVSELQGLKQQNVKPPQVSVSPMPNAKFGPNIGDARAMTLTPRPQTNVSNLNLGPNNVQANANTKNKVPLPNKASPGALSNQIRNQNQTYFRPIQPRPMSVLHFTQNQYQPMQSSSPAPRPYTQINIDPNRKRKSESPDDTRKKYNVTNNHFNCIHNQLIALHGSPSVPTFNMSNSLNKVVQSEIGTPLHRDIRTVKNVATASTGTQANIPREPAIENFKKALEIKAIPAIINDDLFMALQADNDKLLRNTVFTQARGLLRTEPQILQPDIISIKKIPTVTPTTGFENVQSTISNPSKFEDFSIEIIENVVEPENGTKEPNNGPKKDFQVEIVIKRMNEVDDEPLTLDSPNREPEISLRIEEVKARLKKLTEASNSPMKTRDLPNLDSEEPTIRIEEEKAENKMRTEIKTSCLPNLDPQEPSIRNEEEKARNKMTDTLKTRIKTRYLANIQPEEPIIRIEEEKAGNKMATETLKTRLKTRYLANLDPEEPTIRVEEEKAEINKAAERPKPKNITRVLPNLDPIVPIIRIGEEKAEVSKAEERPNTKIVTRDLPNLNPIVPIIRIEDKKAEIKTATSTQKTKNKEKKRLKKETKEPKEESRTVKVTSISDFKGNEIQIAEGSVEKKNTDSYILTHVLDGYVIQESNMAFPIRRPLKEKLIYQNSDQATDQKKEESFKHRTEDGKVIQDNSRILAISDLNLSEDDEITEDEKTEEKNEVKSEEKSEENSEEKSEETSIENCEEMSEETSIENCEEMCEEKSIENSEEKSIEKSEEICDDNPFINLTADMIKTWSAPQLIAHLSKYNWTETITALTEHEIDGESLFLVSQQQLVQIGVSEAHADIICEFIK